ncbi:extracellular solute-binding protein [Enterococcus ureasiticus]|nr:extracellular solute-binding protein [Enterococcus ureasiticus]
MKKLNVRIVGMILAILFVFAGCSSNESKKGETEKNENLIIYTNANSDGRGEWLEEKAKEKGFDITLVTGGGADITSRLIAEKNNPNADIVYGLNSLFYEQLKSEDILTEFVPTWASENPKDMNDANGYYHGIVTQALLLAYNEEKIPKDQAPKSYLDLIENASFKGKYEAPIKLDQATPRIILSSILVQYKDKNGELGISDKGWKAVETFLKNGERVPEGDDFYALLASGDIPIGTLVSGTLQAKEEQYGIPAQIVSPKGIGSPSVIESVALVNGSKKTEKAKEFIEWFGSAEVQGEFSEKFNAMPTNEKAAKKVPKDVQKLFDQIEIQDLDWTFISENIDQWMEKLELEIL